MKISIKSKPKIGITLILICTFFILFEIFLQVRSHYQSGQSVLNAITGRTRYINSPDTGLKLLRPNSDGQGSASSIRTNSLGLRSPEIERKKAVNGFRIAIVGASTVMGEMANTNESTFSYRLMAILKKTYPLKNIEVINAGISGSRLIDQQQILSQIVLPLKPDIVLIYPGFNDFADYCSAASKENRSPLQARPLFSLSLPEWVLTVTAIRRKTTFLRPDPPVISDKQDSAKVDIEPYRQRLDGLLLAASQAGAKVIISTNARAYRPDQPQEMQLKLSAGARTFNPCFDLPGLNNLYDRHNGVIRSEARITGSQLIDLERSIPGGSTYFADSTHFTPVGEALVAKSIFEYLTEEKLLENLK